MKPLRVLLVDDEDDFRRNLARLLDRRGCAVTAAADGPGACDAVARNPESQRPVMTTMLVGIGTTQSTLIYGFLVSLLLLFGSFSESATYVPSFSLLGAGLAMGFGGIGPGIGEGITGGYAVRQVGRLPERATLLTRTMLVGQAVSESTGIYSLVVALLLIINV